MDDERAEGGYDERLLLAVDADLGFGQIFMGSFTRNAN